MSQVTILVRDVAEAEKIKLALTSSTSGIDWKEDWPSDKTADETDDNGHLQISKQEVSVERIVLQNIFVGQL